MNHFAIETWLQVLKLACTDGGYTGRSLSLVCRKMRDIVEPIRFQTVSLVDAKKLKAFVRIIDARNMSASIHHLLIFTNPRTEGDDKGRPISVDYPEEQRRVAELRQIIDKLLSVAAPHVRTLVIQEFRYHLLSSDFTFPVLHDLTIDEADFDSLPDRSHFPSLRRLHVSSYSAVRERDFWSALAHFAPALTHLSLSGVSQDTEISSYLRVLLRIPAGKWPDNLVILGADSEYGADICPADDGDSEAAAVAERLPVLRHVVVQPLDYQNQYDGWCGTGRLKHAVMMKGLRSIAEASARGEGVGKLRLMPEGLEYAFGDAWEDWRDLMDGGVGPWASGHEGNM
ncbi:hypothetical protein PsYK624_158880 [Phanerochaete sordida]|uniref:Uncharacterized protein n=1 Tax=Phanerochaete sordida TaxID=48140 RepID=A0A9P3GQ02_9APHY|nr:hypothetical protein PsYK624_158880 [Phanerochaete sordida]